MEAITANSEQLLTAIRQTLLIAGVSALGALVVGVLVTVARISPVPILRAAAFLFVQYFLNVPLLALLLLGVFALPDAGLVLPLAPTVMIVLALYEGAYVAEAVRSGVNTIAPGEIEAARALGLRFSQIMRRIVVPQALRAVVQPLGNIAIALLMNTALAAAVGVAELTDTANQLNNRAAQPILIYGFVGLCYMALALAIGLAAGRIERRVAVRR